MKVPIRVERKQFKSVKRSSNSCPHRKRKAVSYKRLSIDEFCQTYRNVLGPFLTEFCQMKLLRKKLKQPRYTEVQKWISANIMVATTNFGYKFLCRILPLPSKATIMNYLQSCNLTPGVTRRRAETIKMKVNPQNDNERKVFLLMDEMSLRKGFHFDSSTGTVLGFEDDGKTRKCKLVSSAMCVMAVGFVKNWKFPLGFFFDSKYHEE